MTYFTDSPFERMMVQKPGPVKGQGAQTPASVPGNKCYGCAYGRGRPCAGVCMKKVLATGQAQGGKNGTGK